MPETLSSSRELNESFDGVTNEELFWGAFSEDTISDSKELDRYGFEIDSRIDAMTYDFTERRQTYKPVNNDELHVLQALQYAQRHCDQLYELMTGQQRNGYSFYRHFGRY
jgi:hypothetical protein